MRFLDVKTDYAFKKVFGSKESKPLLISFLNALLEFDGENIVDLTIVDPYQIPMLKGMKDTFVDVKAKLSNDTLVIIEMQVLNVEGFEKRVLYNAAKSYSEQLVKGEKYNLLNPVIALTLTDFKMFPESKSKSAINYFKLLEKESFIEYSDDIELVFIELPKFLKKEDELETVTDKWLYFIKNAGRLDYVPETLSSDEQINKAFDIANEAGLSAEELEIQHKHHDFILLQQGSIELAEKKTKLEIAENLLQAGVAAEIVAQSTELSLKQIIKLNQNING
ncbi:MAG: Rpn family recombination-promoting nuclease/putative transposase [Methylococcaceae bacterium]|nr:Rpn family recombination-promoting nuclease/putative transposase [Methylococcaceae bacterium]